MVVIATVVAVMVSRTLHATTLPHRLTALAYVPAVGILATFVGRLMAQSAFVGGTVFIAAVGGSRYLMRFGGKVRRLGRLALTPLIAVLVTPVPPNAAKTTGPLWGALCGVIAVACVLLSQTALRSRPAREAAAAAEDFARAAVRLRTLTPGSPARARTARAMHAAALVVQDRLDAARLPSAPGVAHPADTPNPPAPDRAALDALASAVLTAEIHFLHAAEDTDAAASSHVPAAASTDPLAAVHAAAAAARAVRAGERPAAEAGPPRPRPGGWRDPQPQARLSAQLVAAMAAAFAVGHLFFPHRWAWTLITAFVVCSAARGRGDVVHRSGLRVLGAFTGAVTGTLVAHVVAGDAPLAVTVIFCYLLIGLWLRETTYAAWAFSVTSLLAVLYSLDGEHGAALLVQRPEGILLGSACGIAAAYFVLPLHTETVMRGRAAHALRVLQDLLTAAREGDPAEVRRQARQLDRAAHDLASVAAPARAHRRLLGRRKGAARPHAADWADSLAACARAARALALADTADLAASRPALGLTALNLGQVRRRLGGRPDAAPPRPARTGPPHLIRLNTCLAELYHRLPAPTAAPVPPPPASPAPAPAG
jgi:hypothetical protein